MKKLYLFIVVVAVAGGRYAYKTFLVSPQLGQDQEIVSEFATGEEQKDIVEEGEQIVINKDKEKFDAMPVAAVSGSDDSKELMPDEDIRTLIEERNTLPKDTDKLTEEDIDLMEQIIQKIQEVKKK